MNFRYRYVRFGPSFSTGSGMRIDRSSEPETLYENELAVDVGGVCWGSEGESRSVLDHHFDGAEFPSAAAAVLHQAERIWKKFHALSQNGADIWLVAHDQPDFDALCATYLSRRILEAEEADDGVFHTGWEKFGISSDGWISKQTRERINWFDPDLGKFERETDRIWPVLLASYASCIDNGKRIACAKQRALHSILYAGMRRGRGYISETNGATEFFREVERKISEDHLNPLFDSVLETSQTFAPERSLLDREVDRYEGDVRRARQALVNIQRSSVEFHQWYDKIANESLFAGSEPGSVPAPNAIHLHPTGPLAAQIDGIYLRDPECLLFKEWARFDRENSSTGEGFLFTAIAYSGLRPAGQINQSDYFFSLDPERAAARGLHLYNIWARLQIEETRRLLNQSGDGVCAPDRKGDKSEEKEKPHCVGTTTCRRGFEARAGAFANCFNDPWFDGSNYECSIVVTPSRGTVIGESGTNSDLTDDPVANLVCQELELSFYNEEVKVRDLSGCIDDQELPPTIYSIAEIDKIPVAGPAYIRFAAVALRESVDPFRHGLAEQVGRLLWRILYPQGGSGVPSDFLSTHLLINNQWIGVWSRSGAAIAIKSTGLPSNKFEELFQEFAELARHVESLSRIQPTADASARVISESEQLMRKLPLLRHQLALPENELPARYFEAAHLGELLAMLRDVHGSAVEKVERQEAKKTDSDMARNIDTMAHLQTILEWIEIFLVSVYAAHLTDMLLGKEGKLRSLIVASAAVLGAIVTAVLVLPTLLKKLSVSLIAIFALIAAVPFLIPIGKRLKVSEFCQVVSVLDAKPHWEFIVSGISLLFIFILVAIVTYRKAFK